MSGTRRVVGCMSGTSMDGVDAALVTIHGRGLGMRATLDRVESAELPCVDRLRAFAEGHAMTARETRALAVALGEAHRDLIFRLTADASPDLIVVHGQTVLHDPPLSWQLIDPWPIATALGTRVVCDLRSRCIAAGGQGAPLTPIADWVLFRSPDTPRGIVNLGGFSNITRLPISTGDSQADLGLIGGGDLCPCNLVLDRLSRSRLGTPFDAGGRAALSGSPDLSLAEQIADRLGSTDRRSLGSGDEASWIDSEIESLSAEDALATACDSIARVISAQSARDEIVLAGGGARNVALVNAIRRHHAGSVRLSDELGVPIHAREAVAFAVLGALADHGVPITLPQITGSTTSGRAGQWILP